MKQSVSADFVADSIFDKRNDYFRIALSFCGNPDDSIDAVSEMTVTAIEKYGKLCDKAAFMSWSKMILVNICRKYLRQRKRSIYLDDLPAELPDGGGLNELSPDMRHALSVLRPIYRETVVMKVLLDYSYKEISALLHIPIGTAQSRCDYGLKCMRKALGGEYDE